MKRVGICGSAVLMLVLCLSISASAYTLELQYFDDSNAANAMARKTGYSGSQVSGNYTIFDTGQGDVTQSASTPSIATGEGFSRQAVVMTDHIDATQSIIHVFAAAGHTDTNYYEGWSRGYGDSYFAFRIMPGPGEALKVWVTIAFGVSGSVKIENVGPSNQTTLNYTGLLQYFDDGEDRQIVNESKTWQGENISTTYSNGGQVTELLDVYSWYFFSGQLTVESQAYGFNFPGENSMNFDAFADIRVVPIPPAILLLGSGLALLGIPSLRRRRLKN